MGKGSKQRPAAVDQKEIERRWEQIFGGGVEAPHNPNREADPHDDRSKQQGTT